MNEPPGGCEEADDQAAAVSATPALRVISRPHKLVGDMSTGDAGADRGHYRRHDRRRRHRVSDNADILGAMTTSIVNANHLLGEVDPAYAFGEEAWPRRDHTERPRRIPGRGPDGCRGRRSGGRWHKLATFADRTILGKSGVLQGPDRAQAESGGGIITRVDDLSVRSVTLINGRITRPTSVPRHYRQRP